MDLAGVIAGWQVDASDLGLVCATAVAHRAGGTEE